MATNPIALESNATSESAIADAVAKQLAQAEADAKQMDEFGRTEAERTIVLDSKIAEGIQAEVDAGNHQTYDDALNYVIARGFAEIKRQRDLARKNAAKSKLATETDLFTNMLAMNPALVTDATFVGKMMAQLAELAKRTK